MSEVGEVPKEIQNSSSENLEEIDEWAPDGSLRPHHFFNPDVRSAIASKEKPKISRTDLFLKGGRIFERATEHLSGGYFKDVLGKTQEDMESFQLSEDDVFDRLSRMPDDAIICFDIKPDEICNSCVIGKHCTATNVRTKTWPFPINDWEKKEKSKLDEIHQALLDKGFKEGKDFIFRDSNSVIFDFDGKALNQVSEPTEKQVVFKSMLAKMGALRSIA